MKLTIYGYSNFNFTLKHLYPNKLNFMASKLKISYVYFFSLLVFIYIMMLNFNLNVKGSLFLKKKFNRITSSNFSEETVLLDPKAAETFIQVRRKFFKKRWKTVQRAPIAHRQ